MLTLFPISVHHFNNNLPLRLGSGEHAYDPSLGKLKLEDMEFETAWTTQKHPVSIE